MLTPQSQYIKSKKLLALRLKIMRESKGFSQQQLAAYLGLDRSTYAYYESAKTLPNIFTILTLCDFYHLDIRYFVSKKNKEFIK